MQHEKEKKKFNLWTYFTTYEKCWFFSILVLAIIFSFIFPETDDPTYSITLDTETVTSNSYDTFDFHGTTGSFVIDTVTVNGEDYAVSDFTDYGEFTVVPENEATLTLTLPVIIAPGDKVAVECYMDSDDGEFVISFASGTSLVGTVNVASLEEGDYSNYSVKENAPKYFVSPWMVTALYLMDIIFNVACELLISKQSKWNFMISLAVEVVEILICIVCAYRWATMATTLIFWIPCDIISFFVWHKNRDKEEEELTVVKSLTPLQDVLVITAIVVWTVVVGYALTFIEVDGGILANNVVIKNVVCYLDACVSAVGIANGIFILLRYREQWIAWYISAIIETVINILSGQYVLLVLKAGYLTNTTYGYIKWTKYIKSHKAEKAAAALKE